MIIDHQKISLALEKQKPADSKQIAEILAKTRELQGLSFPDVLALLCCQDEASLEDIYKTANSVKQIIYGRRLVLFAPLYISNLCDNECLYCAFSHQNSQLKRKALSQNEIRSETLSLINQGHKRLLLVAGEAYPPAGLDFVFQSIRTIYETKTARGNIRRINVNIAPLSVDDFKRLHECQIGTYQLFQETYHEKTYQNMHPRGPKADYRNRLGAMDHALEAGFQDIGLGVLFGLHDWRYEVLALLSHIQHLESKFGLGPHTISVPRIEPAFGSSLSNHPPHSVDDESFKKIIAVLRLAVPYTGIILSTRESAQIRKAAFELGVSQISAGSRTDPGGYSKTEACNEGQFSLGDTRSLHEVIEDIVDAHHIPSFCTSCYRLGRVGKDFMDLAKPGLIKDHCLPNALVTFAEYLYDFANDDLKEKGFKLIEQTVNQEMSNVEKMRIGSLLQKVKNGSRDLCS